MSKCKTMCRLKSFKIMQRTPLFLKRIEGHAQTKRLSNGRVPVKVCLSLFVLCGIVCLFNGCNAGGAYVRLNDAESAILVKRHWPTKCPAIIDIPRRIPTAEEAATVSFRRKSHFYVLQNGTGTHQTIQAALDAAGPGTEITVGPGTYKENLVTRKHGTKLLPIKLVGKGKLSSRPVIQAADPSRPLCKVTNNFIHIQNFIFASNDLAAASIEVTASSVELRDLEVVGGNTGAAIYLRYATNCIIQNNVIRDTRFNQFMSGQTLEDGHGILIVGPSNKILIEGNEGFRNSGDSVQCQSEANWEGGIDTRGPSNVLIRNNRFHGDIENAIDLKTCSLVTVISNHCYDYHFSKNQMGQVKDGGTAIVVHYDARNVRIERNQIFQSAWGISVGSTIDGDAVPNDITIERNCIFNPVSDSTKKHSGSGIQISEGNQITILHNTVFNPMLFTNKEFGVRIGGEINTNGMDLFVSYIVVANNLISYPDRHLDLDTTRTRFLCMNGNFYASSGIPQPLIIDSTPSDLASWKASHGMDCGSKMGSPHFNPYSQFALLWNQTDADNGVPIFENNRNLRAWPVVIYPGYAYP